MENVNVIATFENAELGIGALVIGRADGRFAAVLRDLDANETYTVKILVDVADAIAAAKTFTDAGEVA